MTNSIAELEDTDCLFVIGSNTTSAHPLAAERLLRAKAKGTKLIVVDPRRTMIAEHSHLHVRLRLGSDVALINSIMHVIHKNGWHNEAFIAERTENPETLYETIAKYPPKKTQPITGVDPATVEQIADWYAHSEKSSIVYVLGITQHSTGVDNVKSLANLAMLCGHIGRESTGVNPLRGQNNVQGACDMGVLPNVYPGYQQVASEDARTKFSEAWGRELSPDVGLTQFEQIHALQDGRAKALVVFGANPMTSYPDITQVRNAIAEAEFVLAIDIFPNPTTELADVVLPGASFAESDGTFTNSERRVQRVRKAIPPVGGKEDWEVIQELSNRIGYPMNYQSPSEIFDEMASLTPYYGGLDHARLDPFGIPVPCPTKDHPGTKFLHKDKFARGKGLFHAIEYRDPAEMPDEEYPFWLTTGTIPAHFLTGTMTRHCRSLDKEAPEATVEVNPADAVRLGVKHGDVLRATTRRGSILPRVIVTDRVNPGTVFIPLHFAENAVNRLTNAALDPVSKTPEYKVCAVKLEQTVANRPAITERPESEREVV